LQCNIGVNSCITYYSYNVTLVSTVVLPTILAI